MTPWTGIARCLPPACLSFVSLACSADVADSAAPVGALPAVSGESVPESGEAPTATATAAPGNPADVPAPGGGGGGGAIAAPLVEETPLIVAQPGAPEGGEVPPGCGDGELTDDEACDDGNQASGDGCDASCLATEAGYSCASPGQPCQAIARCGDGLVSASEACDDGNVSAGDGCSPRCRIERGKQCSGQPSTCTDTVCGDGLVEGSEACDDGNIAPFDGCSPSCEREPNCDGAACVSECGDGLIINEECDDGNQLDGDGCSASCTVENGFSCEQHAAECEQVEGQCVLRVPVIYRDFADTHPDFGGMSCNDLVLGALEPQLGSDRVPRLSGTQAIDDACLSTPENFSHWYADSEHSLTVLGELMLFDDENGGFVNRFGANGERFEAVDPALEKNGGATLAECEETCRGHARNGEEPMFDEPLRCDDVCRPVSQQASDLVSGELSALEGDYNRASDAVPRDEAAIADLEAQMAEVRTQIEALEDELAVCESNCTADLDVRTATCTATCKACSGDPERFCIGGEAVAFDGNPLFFPVDSITGDTANQARAQIPAQYGYSNWPWEDNIFPDASEHNFFFTSEVRHWFRYDTTTNATLHFLGDDDVWVFVNGHLAVDLGGIHQPALGSVTVDAASQSVSWQIADGIDDGFVLDASASAEEFGLLPGEVYEISIFHAERRLNGSSFKLTLAGFDATPSDCSAICGDGVLAFGEECDDGDNDGGYGECGAGCLLGPFCGDGIVQEEFGEDCDDGPLGSASCPGCRILKVRVR